MTTTFTAVRVTEVVHNPTLPAVRYGSMNQRISGVEHTDLSLAMDEIAAARKSDKEAGTVARYSIEVWFW